LFPSCVVELTYKISRTDTHSVDARFAMSRQFSPQERLGDFIQNGELSPDTVETLRNFLCTYEPTYRKRIINAQLPRFYNRTSVHLAAEKGLTPFLRILLKHGGELVDSYTEPVCMYFDLLHVNLHIVNLVV